MKVVVCFAQSEFTKVQQAQLSTLGEVVYLSPPIEHPLEELIKFANGAEILGIDPDNFGGFEKAKQQVTALSETLSTLKGLALDTTSGGWVDLDYFKKRNIPVSHCPSWSRESVAEHTIALLLCLAKRIITTDRKTQKGQYKLEMGFELKGKVLGIIGLGSIGSRTAELAVGLGMRVIAYNHSSKSLTGVEMKTLDELLQESDAIALHVTHRDDNKDLISTNELNKVKNGVIVVNTADRTVVNEAVMAEALKSGKVFGYAFEAEDLNSGPLAGVENAVALKGFGWYTKEALANLMQVWVDNIVAMANGDSKNRIV